MTKPTHETNCTAIAHGFGFDSIAQTGGGCTGWEKALPDGTTLLVTFDGHTHIANPRAKHWGASRHNDEHGGYVEVDQPMTLAQALLRATTLRAPVGDEQTTLEG